jgi:hypothetical protein
MRSIFSGRSFGIGTLAGLTGLSLALASVPHSANLGASGVGDTAITQELSEIRVKKESAPNFDSDIQRLSSLESRYHDKPVSAVAQKQRLAKPLERVSKRTYQPSQAGVNSKAYRP